MSIELPAAAGVVKEKLPEPSVDNNCPVVPSVIPKSVRTVAASAILSLSAIELVIVVLKFASSPSAAASSFRVLRVAGELSMRLEIAVSMSDCVTEPAFVILASTLESV